MSNTDSTQEANQGEPERLEIKQETVEETTNVDTEPEPRRRYVVWNYIAIVGHLLSALGMIALYAGKTALLIPLTETYLEWKRTDSNSTC